MVQTFKKEILYSDWFREHLKDFGYSRAFTTPHNPNYSKPFPDYWCERISDGRLDGIELELFPSRFIEHKHDITKTDFIYCADDDRMFYPDFPEEVSKKIIITKTRAYSDIRSMKALEKRCKRCIDEKKITYSLLQALSWTGKDNECMICGIKMNMTKNMVTKDVIQNHTKCGKKLITHYKRKDLLKVVMKASNKNINK